MRKLLTNRGFTLIELLVVVAVISLLISILMPALAAARRKARSAVDLANLRVLGHGTSLYVTDNRDVFVPGRLPRIDDCNSYADILGGRKFRPTFAALMSTAVGAPPFEPPMTCKTDVDPSGEPGDRQNYSYDVYVCPSVGDWTDERNGSYGFNYQFLGNSRLFDDDDLSSYKRWPVKITDLRYPGETVAVADCMGTAASWPPSQRQDYDNNSRDADRFGNEGFNLDPPRVDPVDGEMANFDGSPQSRTAPDPRHDGKANVLWVDGHASANTLEQLGYEILPDGVFGFEGDNSLFTGSRRDLAWTPDYRLE